MIAGVIMGLWIGWTIGGILGLVLGWWARGKAKEHDEIMKRGGYAAGEQE